MRDLPLAKAYRKSGFGLGGVLLKQSLYPRELLRPILEGARLVLDLGCGEGLLTNLLAREFPGTRFIGVDRDAKKIAAAQACRVSPAVEFHAADFFTHPLPTGADVVLFNDVLHHLSPEQQVEALELARTCLAPDGVLVLKEVDRRDTLDVKHTTFWDNRLYPADTLRFSTPTEWKDRLQRLGFRSLGVRTVRHPWIASRTLLWFTRRPKLAASAPALPPPATTPTRTVLVTGATGFIGEWVVRELLTHGLAGEPVQLELVVRTPAALASDLAQHPQIRVLAGDLTDGAFMTRLSGRFDVVFHLAAAVDYFGGEAVYANNLEATKQLLAACVRLGPGRFIYTSTMGALDRGRGDRGARPLDETSPFHPTSPYGRAKWHEEEFVRDSDLNWTIARIPWCYGPGMAESHHVRNLMNRVRLGSLAGKVDWPGRVSVIEVREAARLLVAAAANPATAHQTFFASEDEPVRIGALFAEMGLMLGSPGAGARRLSRWCWALLRLGSPLLPFQLKCLVTDALVVSSAHARSLGIEANARSENWLLPLARYDAEQRFPLRRRRVALITGAAGGIGASLARQFHARGYGLALADRNETALRARCAELNASDWVVDLTADDLPERIAQAFPAADTPEFLVNNAGIGWRGDAWQATPADNARVLGVNAIAPMTLSGYFLRHAVRPLTVVNIASTAAFQPLPYMAAYAAAKSFLLSYSLALEAELQSNGRPDRVITVVPSGTQTGFQSASGVKTNPKEKLLSPTDVATAITQAIARHRTLVFVGGRAYVMRWLSLALPLKSQARFWAKLMSSLR